jgi:hypothetical protein
MKESLEREIYGSLGRLEGKIDVGFHDVTTRFDTQAGRLERQGGLLQTGSRWTVRMNEWAEKVDRSLETKDRQIAELRARLEKLEGDRPAR